MSRPRTPTALQDLGLPTGSLALSLAGFNVGVELGQLAIVAVFLPAEFKRLPEAGLGLFVRTHPGARISDGEQ